MGTVRGKGKPKGFQIMPEGEQVLHITGVTGKPRANIQLVELTMKNEDGISLTGSYKQKYDLTNDGGYAAFYFLVKNALGVDLDEGDEFDIDDLEGIFITAEIVHKEGRKQRDDGTFPIFANIAKVIGPGEPFEVEGGSSTADDDEDYD